jgi:hypothetical protein
MQQFPTGRLSDGVVNFSCPFCSHDNDVALLFNRSFHRIVVRQLEVN